MVDNKQDFVRRAKLNDSILKKNGLIFTGAAFAGTRSAAEFDRNSNRRPLGKKLRQPSHETWFQCARGSLVSQFSRPQCLVGRSRVSSLPGLEDLRGDSLPALSVI